MLRNRPLLAIALTALVVSFLLLYIHTNLKQQITQVQELWTGHYQVALKREEQLNVLRKSFGYGGFIHYFKNYLLRQDPNYIPAIDRSLVVAESSIENLHSILDSDAHQNALQELSLVVLQYKKNYALLRQLMESEPKLSITELDQRVRVDDTPAYVALQTLASSFATDLESVKGETEKQLKRAHNRLQIYQFLVMPIIYLAAIICMVYLLRTNKANTKLRAILASTPDALVVIDEMGRIQEFNDNALTMFGYSAAAFRKLCIDDLVPEGSARHHRSLRNQYIDSAIKPGLQKGRFNDVMGVSRNKKEFSAKTIKGELIPVEVELSAFYEGNHLRILAVVKNLTQKKKLEVAANTDVLTGLANRRSAEAMLNKELTRAKRYRRDLAVIMLDLDHFKRINDTHGHKVGDDALVAVAQVLKRHVRSSDMAARYGGEEFILIYPETDLDSVFTIAESIRYDVEALKVPPIEKITASMGVSVYRGDDGINTIDLLLQQADSALYEAKENGRNQVRSKYKNPA